MNILLVAAGGALGSVLRYWVQLALNAAWFPWGTLMVNVAGSAVIGVLGGFTTFSAFSLDAVELWQRSILLAAAYMAASVSLSILVCAAMYSAVKS